VSARVTFATSLRVLTQLRRDPRTIALLMLVPPMLQALLKGAFYQDPDTYQRIGGPLLGMFPLSTMFVVTSVTMLRERTTGTLERLMSMPMGKLDLLFGYGIAFSLVAIVQASFTAAIVFGVLGLNVAGSTVLVVAIAVGNALLGMGLGLFASAFAETEYQAVQFLPAIVIPQFLLCGLFTPRDQMIGILHALSDVLPLTYAFEALERITNVGHLGSQGVIDVIVIFGVTILLLIGGGSTIRRRTS
jgi:ABC-2 type transport system permease protein